MIAAVNEIVNLLETTFTKDKVPYHLHEPNLDNNEQEMLTSCIKEGFVSYLGKRVIEFESKLSRWFDVKHALALVNGTSALHALLVGMNFNQEDEILCPTLTFVGTANAIALSGAIPHFIDCEQDGLNLCSSALEEYLTKIAIKMPSGYYKNRETGRRIAAILPVHIIGHPCKMAEIKKIAQAFSLELIEDSAQALGSYYLDKPLCGWGRAGIVSFNGNKIITTGGGGAILTNDTALFEKVKHITSTAKMAHPWHFYHDQIAFNYRMPSLNAAVGIAQLSKLGTYLIKKRKLADMYYNLFKNAEYWEFISEPSDTKSNYWLNSVKLKHPDMQILEAALEALQKKQIFCRPLWQLMHTLTMFQNCPRMETKNADKAINQVLSLPSSPKLWDMINGS